MMTMHKRSRVLTLLMLIAFLAFALAAPFSADASRRGRRNTAIGLGAGAAGLLLTHHYVSGAVLGAGAVGAATQINKHPHRSGYYYNGRYYSRR